MAMRSAKLATLSLYIAACAIDKQCVSLQKRQVVASVSDLYLDDECVLLQLRQVVASVSDPYLDDVDGVVKDIKDTANELSDLSVEIRDIAEEIQSAGAGAPGQVPPTTQLMHTCQVLLDMAKDSVSILSALGMTKEQVVNLHSRAVDVIQDIMNFAESIPGGMTSENIPDLERVAHLVEFTHWVASQLHTGDFKAIRDLSSELHTIVDTIPQLPAAGGPNPTTLDEIQSMLSSAVSRSSSSEARQDGGGDGPTGDANGSAQVDSNGSAHSDRLFEGFELMFQDLKYIFDHGGLQETELKQARDLEERMIGIVDEVSSFLMKA